MSSKNSGLSVGNSKLNSLSYILLFYLGCRLRSRSTWSSIPKKGRATPRDQLQQMD